MQPRGRRSLKSEDVPIDLIHSDVVGQIPITLINGCSISLLLLMIILGYVGYTS